MDTERIKEWERRRRDRENAIKWGYALQEYRKYKEESENLNQDSQKRIQAALKLISSGKAPAIMII
ncbi:MAG: hypothetical protein IJP62_13965 [Treponema sp.]|nr:hypothetical protein [Treponema sp.]